MQAAGSIKQCLRCLFGVLAAGVMLVMPPLEPQRASAQAFDGAAVRELYRRNQRERMQQQPMQQAPAQIVRPAAPQKPRTTPRRTQPATPPAPAAVEKLAAAKVVLVIGDFMASGVAEGLSEMFAQDAGIRVVDRANGSSGIVREDHYNWPGEIGGILDQDKPAAVVVMLGSNDRQQMKAGDERLEPRSDGWMKEYTRRATALATAVESRGIPVIWVGMPPFRQASLTSDMLAYNDVFKAVSATAEADYVDIWDGFVDENGAFVTTGPDMNGQQARLRGSDGINLTAAGKRKIAFYAEKPLRRVLGSGSGDAIGLIGPAYTPGADLRPGAEDKIRIVRTVPISLTDPELDGGTTLLGGDTTPSAGTAADIQMREQREAGTQTGRADDFAGKADAAKSAPEGTASITPPATAPAAQ
ncbi:DUF459 domain-containing protein [Tianweitania populi]|uniref:DUF459 domain-containing protein n=1 Tax=Tianweitania populi TaxID=1607949 RepID=A0A8J3DW20_9HYPH|nr:DUF459 domain-containing protein [Tianweitania populi]GHD11509.1 hypothetical protein GCM10016234_14730 [Tianweitania populi]